MLSTTTPIIPSKQTFVEVQKSHTLDLEAICVFTAIGFFLDQDTYWKHITCLKPATETTFDASKQQLVSKPWFTWHYTPRQISFSQALNEFSSLFESIIAEHTQGKHVILPLSGGLDSRTQAAALQYLNAEVTAYSYEFENGYPETSIAKQIAAVCNFNFKTYKIRNGYLWSFLDELAKINGCYSDFTSPRQMAIYSEFLEMGDVFSLGHWGDVLFDSMNLPQLSAEEEATVIANKLLKRGGLKLATRLWDAWGLKGNFKSYFISRVETLLKEIKISDTNAKLRAFKSLYWAPRWTSVNLSVFENQRPITLPYYDNRMCEFICTIPEVYLKNRQLQIAYIKKRSPQLAKITWQDQRPFNLYNYHYNKTPYNLPYKIRNKIKRILNKAQGDDYVQRNWELQFLGKQNQAHVKHYLFNTDLDQFIPESLITFYFDAFYEGDYLDHAHAINMLLVLSKFNALNISNK